jgi:hypothetical protein
MTKAAPPRPTLLCGDLLDCHQTFSRLKTYISALQESNLSWPDYISSADRISAVEFDHTGDYLATGDLVPLVRRLRESLLALGENKTPFAQQVYECAADVCIQAYDYPEALKCFQQLLSLYQQLDDDDDGQQGQQDGNITNYTPASLALKRWPEVAAAYVAYFKCIPGSDALDTAATLRRLPRHVLASQHVKLALSAIDCLSTGNYVGFFSLIDRDTTPPLLKGVLQSKVKGIREHAMVVVATAYRVVPTAVVLKWLGLGMREYSSLLRLIEVMADKGYAGALCALESVQMDNERQAEKLVFK